MEHSFDKDIATIYGLNEAIILQHLLFWIEKNEANNVNFYDGAYWTYNSTKAFKKIFPYFSERQIQNTLKKLKEQDIIRIGNYNKSSYDRTLWYAFTKKGKSIMQKCKMEVTKVQNGIDKSAEPIPDINTVIEPYIEPYILLKEPKMKEKIEQWLKYKKERKQSYTSVGIKTLLKKINTYTEKYGADKVIEIIDTTIANNYQGIIFERLDQVSNNQNSNAQNHKSTLIEVGEGAFQLI